LSRNGSERLRSEVENFSIQKWGVKEYPVQQDTRMEVKTKAF